MVQIESLRLRYFPFSHRPTLRLRETAMGISTLSLYLRNSSGLPKRSGSKRARTRTNMCGAVPEC